MGVSHSRRAFLRGRLRPGPQPLRPPWALYADAFERLCSACGECAATCPEGILRTSEAGLPVVDFSAGQCTFCGECVKACTPGALRREEGMPPWTLEASVGAGCLALNRVECRICGEICDESAIRFRPRMGGSTEPRLIPERCTGCGACVAPCPVGAIKISTPGEDRAPHPDPGTGTLETRQ